jgi:ABC-type sugar transport system permease subunit
VRQGSVIDGRAQGFRPAPAHSRWGFALHMHALEPYVWITPAFIVYALFFGYPVYIGATLGFFNWSGYTPLEERVFVGFRNYLELFHDDVFLVAVKNSVIYAVVTTSIYCIICFALAFALWYRSPRWAGPVRAFLFYPSVLSTAILALAWSKIYALDGPLNGVLSAISGQAVDTLWLADTQVTFWAVMWTDVWRSAGWYMVLFLAGMSNIPRDLVDSARAEGASSLQLALHVVEPLIRPATGLAVLLSLIWGLQIFAPIWVMTRGGPVHSTEVLATFSYLEAFQLGRVGYAAAGTSIGVLLLFVLAVVRVRQLRIV